LHALLKDIFVLLTDNREARGIYADVGYFFESLVRQTDPPEPGKLQEEDFFKLFFNMETITNNIGEILIPSAARADKSNIYAIKKSYFNEKGEIIISKVEKDRKELLDKIEKTPISFREDRTIERPASVRPFSFREDTIIERPASVRPFSVIEEKPISFRQDRIVERPRSFREDRIIERPISFKQDRIVERPLSFLGGKKFIPKSDTMKKIVYKDIPSIIENLHNENSKKRSRKRSKKRSRRCSKKRSRKCSKKRSRKYSKKRSRKCS
jgi:hypothetical protein